MMVSLLCGVKNDEPVGETDSAALHASGKVAGRRAACWRAQDSSTTGTTLDRGCARGSSR